MASRKRPDASKGKGKAGGKRPCRGPPEPAEDRNARCLVELGIAEPAEEEIDNCQMDACHITLSLCTAGTQQRYCWLREELPLWNAMLNCINLQLCEYEPGRMSIQSLPLKGCNFSRTPIFQDAAMLLVWLLDHHRCIDRFSLSQKLPAWLLLKAMRHGSNLRHVSLTRACRRKEQSLAKAFDALRTVESLYLTFPAFSLGQSSLPAACGLIERSARTLSTLELRGPLFPSEGDEAAMDAVSRTKTLRELLLYGCSVTGPGLGKIAELLRSTQTLSKLTLHVAPAVHSSWHEVGDALRYNTSLVELSIGVQSHHCWLTPVLEALETNSTLKCLHITSTLYKAEIVALGSSLGKNTCLTTLKLSQPHVKSSLVSVLAEVLLFNSTLECLDMTASGRINLREVKGLYTALTRNSSLKRLAFAKGNYFGDDREGLARMLFESGCSHRVVADWRTEEFPFLIRTVKETHSGPVELHLLDDGFINNVGCELFDALSQSTTLWNLVVTSWIRHSLIWRVLVNTLASSNCIKSLQLNLNGHKKPSDPIALIAEALATNTSVLSLLFVVDEFDFLTSIGVVRPLARLVTVNRTLIKLTVSSFYAVMSPVLLEPLAAATEENHVILDVTIGAHPPHGSASVRICEALRRNMQMLSWAREFVMGSYVTRDSAEAYERLRCKGSLLLTFKATEGTQEDPSKLLVAAEYRLRCNYLVLTNIVKRKVECYAAPHTQIDALNDACWYQIAKYLRVSDVKKESMCSDCKMLEEMLNSKNSCF
ncbi:uncharacterized protein LOC144106725 [Amblyomma americanum]